MTSSMEFPRGRTSKPKSRPDASPRKSSQKSKAEGTEEDSQQKYVGKDEHIDSNDAGDTRVKLNRNSTLKSCAEFEAAKMYAASEEASADAGPAQSGTGGEGGAKADDTGSGRGWDGVQDGDDRAKRQRVYV